MISFVFSHELLMRFIFERGPKVIFFYDKSRSEANILRISMYLPFPLSF